MLNKRARERAQVARTTLTFYSNLTEECFDNVSSLAIGLLEDLRHLCDEEHVEFEDVLDKAANEYRLETEPWEELV